MEVNSVTHLKISVSMKVIGILSGCILIQLCTSNTGSPVKRLKAANSRMMVPAHAVHVSVSVPVLVSGPQIPCFKFTCQAEGKQPLHNLFSKLASNLLCRRVWIKKLVIREEAQDQTLWQVRGKHWCEKGKYEIWVQVVLQSQLTRMEQLTHICVQNGSKQSDFLFLYSKKKFFDKKETMLSNSDSMICLHALCVQFVCVCVFLTRG